MSYTNEEASNIVRITVMAIIGVMMAVALYFVMTSPGIVPKGDDIHDNHAHGKSATKNSSKASSASSTNSKSKSSLINDRE